MRSAGERPGGVAKQREGARTQQEAPSLPPISSQHGGACAARREYHSEWAHIISPRIEDTAEEMKGAVVKIHSVHVVRTLFLWVIFFF